MWKSIVKKDSNGKKKIHYRLICNRCKRVYKEHGRVVSLQNMDMPSDDDCYLEGTWHIHNGIAVCPKCQNAIDADIYDDEYEPKLDLKSWKTWIKGSNKKLVNLQNKDKSYFDNVVLPTMEKYGFVLYNEDCDYMMQNDKPRDVAIRAIYRGGNPENNITVEEIEFVYYITENKHECPYIDIFWRKK
jgi:hypothetical protein